MPTSYPTELKVKTIRRYEKGESIKALSQELHIAQTTLYQWRKQYCSIETPNRTYTPKEFDAVCRRLQKLDHEMEIIHLSGYLSNIPLQKKLATLEELYNRPENSYSVYELCDAFGVARGTFYNHIFRRADRSKHEEEQAQLALKVKQIFDDSEQRYGAEKIRAVLAQNGIRVGTKRIADIMRELSLYSVWVDAKKLFKRQRQRDKENMLKRKFSAEHPNQIWVSDFTYFKIKDYWVYLCIIIDLYSRKVIGYRISRNASTNLVTTTFRTTYEERGRPQRLTFHSDRGKQYTSNALSTLLQQYGVRHSFSASGKPLDNAISESFFATFKKEEAYRREYTSERHFRKSVDEYIRFYNEVRPHQTLHYKTPQSFEDTFQVNHVEKQCSK